MEPASMSEFFVNRLGEKGHNDETGLMRSNIGRRTREKCRVRKEKEPPGMMGKRCRLPVTSETMEGCGYRLPGVDTHNRVERRRTDSRA